jgi:hypothetical protein
MRGFTAGVVAGATMMAATTLLASPAVFGFAAGVQATDGQGVPVQWVDRRHKGDRLDAGGRVPSLRQQPAARKPERILTGCEPALSPLSVSARAGNFPRRCVS